MRKERQWSCRQIVGGCSKGRKDRWVKSVCRADGGEVADGRAEERTKNDLNFVHNFELKENNKRVEETQHTHTLDLWMTMLHYALSWTGRKSIR